MLNINNSKHGTTVVGGQELEIGAATASSGNNATANLTSVGSTAAAAILQNNSLRKSMPGSTSGLRSLQTTMNANNQIQLQQHQQQPQQPKFTPNQQGRQSHSQSQHTHQQITNQRDQNQQNQQTYHSVTSQSRGQAQQLNMYSQGLQKGSSNAATVNNNYGGSAGSAAVSATAGTAPAMKYQNAGLNGVANHVNILNHKQFNMSTQQGLFPKITNLRIDNQSIPNSAHSNGHGPQGSGPIQSAATMNVLKNSGGHISGMSNHHAHHNLNQANQCQQNERQQHHLRGVTGSVAANNQGGGLNLGGTHQYKPLSSPRSSQQHNGHISKENQNNQNDPNFLYQQQLSEHSKQAVQYKTPNSTTNNEEPSSGVPDSANSGSMNIQQQSFQSPGPAGPTGVQAQLDQQRAKQISSGSEKRLKMHQQRQYYSEQYRVQQQKQHQQTANAVLQQSGPQNPAPSQPADYSNSNSTTNTTGPAAYKVGASGRDTGGALNSQEYMNSNANRSGKVHSSHQPQAQAIQTMTPQIYSQQRQRQPAVTGGAMHNTQMINNQAQMNGSMLAPGQQHTVQIPQHHHKQQQLSNTMNSQQSYQQSGQVFFKKRASSNNTSQHQNILASPSQNGEPSQQPSQHQQIVSQQKLAQARQEGQVTSPKNQSVQNQSQSQSQSAAGPQQAQQTQQAQTQQQQPPKIPVICGFHKRILLITCQGNNGQNGPGDMPTAQGGLNGVNPNSSMSQARRIRNKNPNCNHNSNSVFYQPHYNNVKYDDSHKKKEDVLRKVFFKECAKEEEKRLYNGSQMFPNGQYPGGQGAPGPNGHMYTGPSEVARQQAFSQANDPNKHLQIIERILCEYLFVQMPFDRSQKQQLSNTQSLMMELGLDRALTPHRAFLLALIRAGKFTADNMLKVLSEVKTSATEFDNECIYCKYSQYALKESAKLLQKHQAALQEQSQTNPQQALAQQQQIQANGGIIKGPSGEDIRIENLVRMFQSQLFKKSFINTSLMIIQRKMTEKYFQKYHNAKQAQQAQANGQSAATQALAGQAVSQGGAVQYGPDGKPLEPPKRPAKKNKPKNQQNLSSLENLSKEIQKLSKNLANPKDKERYLELKEKYYREFLVKVLKSNGVEKIQFPTASFTPYKYYIGRGNNSGIVRTALKSRFWWSMGDFDDWEDYNFIWTQWKSNKILSCIKSWKEVQELELKEQGANGDKKRSSQSTRAGGHIDSQLSTQATDKESTSSKENLITTPKKNKLASSTLGNTSSEPQFKKQNSATANSSATKNGRVIGRVGKKGEEKEEEKEENITSHNLLAYTKMENNYHLSNKKAIYYNMKIYYEAVGKDYHQHLPLTFHIKEGLNDPQFLKFEQLFHDAQDPNKVTILDNTPKFGKNLWIIKPGENTNRGCGIQVSRELDHIKGLIQNINVNGNRRSYIIQKYIERPLLYKGRKFDMRTFTMMCSINGNLQGYWYADGYFRTSSREFTLKNISNRYVHLTNDAVQKKLDDYGKFESGNKLSYPEFQKYLDSMKIDCDLVKTIIPKMKGMAMDSMRAVSRKLDPSRKTFSFEIFGYDFMIDEDLNPWMIEVNTNPCFELSSPYLARLIPAMVENALKIAVDPIFPPPPVPNSKKHTIPDAQDNKFELIFNERIDAAELKNLPIDDNMNGIIEEEEMEEEGSDVEDDDDDKD